MTKHTLANSQPVHQSLAEEDSAEPDRAQGAVGLTCNVTATVTAGAAAPRPSRGAAAHSADAGHVRVRGTTVNLDSEIGKAFVTDCARNTEGLLSECEFKQTWGLAEEDWTRLSENTSLLNAIRAERNRRIANGDAAREAAQRYFANAPTVLGGILTDELVSPRHRIEAAKELRQVAGNGPESQPPGEKFVITIDLGGNDRLVYEKEMGTRAPSMFDDGDLP
jgi:hypothetical protein